MLWPLAAKMTTKMANTDHYPKTASLFASLPAVYVHTSTWMHQERGFCCASWILFPFRGARASMYLPLCEGIFFIRRKVRGGYWRLSIFPGLIFVTTFPPHPTPFYISPSSLYIISVECFSYTANLCLWFAVAGRQPPRPCTIHYLVFCRDARQNTKEKGFRRG